MLLNILDFSINPLKSVALTRSAPPFVSFNLGSNGVKICLLVFILEFFRHLFNLNDQ